MTNENLRYCKFYYIDTIINGQGLATNWCVASLLQFTTWHLIRPPTCIIERSHMTH